MPILVLCAFLLIPEREVAAGNDPQEPSRQEVISAIRTIEGFDNFLVLKEYSASKREIQLGRDLFFNPALSRGGVMSCGTCHQPARDYSDGLPRARGRGGLELRRNAPALRNTALDPHYQTGLFRDGRAKSVEDVVLSVLREPLEFDSTPEALVATLRHNERYARRFQELYGPGGVTAQNAAKAIATFVRSLPPTRPSPFDRVLDDWGAMTPAQKRGLLLFAGKAHCVSCHWSPDLSSGQFANTGLKPLPGVVDEGRFEVTHSTRDWRAFKIPSLRNVSVTGPYMHDGSLATLADVINFYDRGGDVHQGQDTRIQPLHLSFGEKKDLEAFLHSLTSPPEPGDPPLFDTPLPAPIPGPRPARSRYWMLAPRISYLLNKGNHLFRELDDLQRPWTARADYSEPGCSATPDSLVRELEGGRFNAEEISSLNERVFWDLVDYYKYRAFTTGDLSLCARLRYQGDYFAASSGYYQCRNWLLQMNLIYAMVTRPPDFGKVCRKNMSIDKDALRYLPTCPVIEQNLDDSDAMCDNLYGPFLLVTSLRSCKALFAPLHGAPLDCTPFGHNPTGTQRCEDYGDFLRAYRRHDPALCGASEGCRVMMGEGDSVASRIAGRIRAKLCSQDSGRSDYRRETRRSIEALLAEADQLLAQAPKPPEAVEQSRQVAKLKRRLEGYSAANGLSAVFP